MALPSSGQITLAQIRDEVSPGTTSNVSLRALSSAAGFSTPDTFSEFYGYSAFTPPSIDYSGSPYSATGTGTVDNPYIITLSASSMNFVEEDTGEGFSIYRYETFHNGTGFKFICQEAGQYRVYADLTGGSVSNLSNAPNSTAFQVWTPSGWNNTPALGFSIDRDSGSDSFAAMVASPERNKSLTTNFNVGDIVIGMRIVVQKFYGAPTFNNIVFRMKFEKV